MTTTTSKSKPPAPNVPLAIWPVGQVPAHEQRSGRYLTECTEHPAVMIPSLAQRIIEEYSKPGDLVVDPMCGIGTTLVEGAALRRRAIGIEAEQRWVGLAKKNLRLGLSEDQRHLASVRTGDARSLPHLLADVAGRVNLICASPPGAGRKRNLDKRQRGKGSVPRPTTAGNHPSRANLDDLRGDARTGAVADIYAACFEVLRPGGLLVVVTTNARRQGAMFDLAGSTVSIARALGFSYLQHVVALHAAIGDGSLSASPSFGQRTVIRKARDRGEPTHLVVHDDVSVLRKPSEPAHGR